MVSGTFLPILGMFLLAFSVVAKVPWRMDDRVGLTPTTLCRMSGVVSLVRTLVYAQVEVALCWICFSGQGEIAALG